MGHSHSSTASHRHNTNDTSHSSSPLYNSFPRINRHLASSSSPSPTLLNHSLSSSNSLRSPNDTLEERFTVIDGGFVAPINDLYHANHHFEPGIVRDLIIKRKLAPFYIGLDDVDEDEIQAIARSLDPTDISLPLASSCLATMSLHQRKVYAESIVKLWMARIGGAVECPICFLYYPSNVNKSQCCDQPICTECFVQIKRSDALHSAECPFCVMPRFSIIYAIPNSHLVHQKLPQCQPHLSPFDSTNLIHQQNFDSSNNYSSSDVAVLSSSLPFRQAVKSESTEQSSSNPVSPLTQPPNELARSPPSISSLTITATTHTRPSRLLGPPVNSIIPVSFTQRHVPNTFKKPDVPTTGHLEACDVSLVTSDCIRPSYVRRLQQDHQLSILREHQDAASSRLRRMFQESFSNSSQSPSSSESPITTIIPGSSSAAAFLSAMGIPHRHVERLYLRAMGTDVEEFMVMEAMRASLADEEQRQHRVNGLPEPSVATSPPLNSNHGLLQPNNLLNSLIPPEGLPMSLPVSSPFLQPLSSSLVDEDDTPLGLLTTEKRTVSNSPPVGYLATVDTSDSLGNPSLPDADASSIKF